jgi:hypothetical protein
MDQSHLNINKPREGTARPLIRQGRSVVTRLVVLALMIMRVYSTDGRQWACVFLFLLPNQHFWAKLQ